MTPDPAQAALNDTQAFYIREALAALPRLLGMADREPDSVTYGSLDRDHWGWKFRDFPVAMLQAATYPLALAFRAGGADNPYRHNPRLLEWIEAALRSALSRQQRNGAFAAIAPNTVDYGMTLAAVYWATETLRALGEAAAADLHRAVGDTVRRACDFALPREEEHAFISNHQALFALAFLNASSLLGDPRYCARAEAIVAGIQARQSPDGWYREYGGPDPGYESLGIFYLSTYWHRTQAPSLLTSLRRAVDFYAHGVHPDGSIGGVYGTRCTSLYVPGGFELLAPHVPMAAAVAAFMRERLDRHNVVTPGSCDAHNLGPLLYGYLEAAAATITSNGSVPPLLPCQALAGVRAFDDSGLVVIGMPRYYAVLSASKGGVCRLFDRRTQRIAYEDAGYYVEAGRRWTSQAQGLGRRLGTPSPVEVACETPFVEVRQEQLTPARLLVLRLLNLTVFRSPGLASALQTWVVRRLITARRAGPLRLRRSVTFGDDAVHFRDCLEATRPVPATRIRLPRALTPIHMGSAKYFHQSELEVTPEPDCSALAEQLRTDRRAVNEFTIAFSDDPTATAAPGVARSVDVEVSRR